MPRQPIATDRAPAAIGPYSQAVRAGNAVYLSGQIPLDPKTMNMGRELSALAKWVLGPIRWPVSLLKELRPKQWTKNAIVFAGLVFAKRLTDPVVCPGVGSTSRSTPPHWRVS